MFLLFAHPAHLERGVGRRLLSAVHDARSSVAVEVVMQRAARDVRAPDDLRGPDDAATPSVWPPGPGGRACLWLALGSVC
jgi:hypothetical protein